jgi:hypothetical protein
MKAKVLYPPDVPGEHEQWFAVETVAAEKAVALEEIFRRFNVVTGDPETEDAVRLKCRSMSVGDMVVFEDGTRYLCAPCGWNEIDAGRMDEILAIEDFGKRSLAVYGFGQKK